MKKLLVLVVLLWATVLHAQITYWWSQMLKKPDAKQSQEYFFVPGTNIYFTYATNRVIINGSGTNVATATNAINAQYVTTATLTNQVYCTNLVGSCSASNFVLKTGDTMSGALDIPSSPINGTNIFLVGGGCTNTLNPCSIVTVGGALYSTWSPGVAFLYGDPNSINLDATGLLSGPKITFTAFPNVGVFGLDPSGRFYVDKDFVSQGIFYGDGSGLTNLPCCTNGAFSGSFTGDGSGLTNLNVQTNWSFTAITNSPWLTNFTLADLPSGVLTNNWNGGTIVVTGAVYFAQTNQNLGLMVSNGVNFVNITNGALRTSGGATIGNGLTVSAGNVTVSASSGNVSATSFNAGQSANTVLTGIGGEMYLRSALVNSNLYITTTGTGVVKMTNQTGGLVVENTIAATNGFLMQVKPQFTTNFTCTTNLQTYICNGTNQVITLPTGSAINDIVYRFSCTNGWGKFIISNGISGGTIRDGFSSTFTQVGIGSPAFFTHDGGTNWVSAARTRVVMPNAQFSCSTNIPLTLANTAYPVTLNSTDFDNSQGIALAAGTNGLSSKMWITNAGQYEFTPSIVFTNGNVSHIVRYWFRSNDTNIPNSCTPTKFSGNDTYVVTVPFLINITQPTAIEIWAESTGTGEQLCALPASGNFPATPSVIIPVKRISDPWP